MLIAIISLLVCTFFLPAQPPGTLKGVITDQSGALVPGTTITMTRDGNRRQTTSDNSGVYMMTGLAPGTYTVQASSPGLSQDQISTVTMDAGTMTLNIQMRVVVERQEITVNDTVAPQLSIDPTQTASTEVMRDSDLEALSDDADDLVADLQALAGPSAGPNGGQVFIDGFTAGDGTLPNKSAIREVRINQNPFSPEFDTLGTGHIEILTKPGSDHLRGEGFFTYGNGIFNSRNPYADQKAPFDLKDFGGSLSGHFSSRGSFFLDLDKRDIDNGAVINAITLNPATLAIVSPFTQVYVSPLARLHIGARGDYTVNSKTTLTVFYGLTKTDATNAGVGNFELPSRGYNSDLVEHAIRATNTIVLSDTMVNETRFQFQHQNSQQTPENNAPAITVANAFDGGGNSAGLHDYLHHHFEGQNLSTKTWGTHIIKFGVRIKAVYETDTSEQNFNGNYIFGGAYAPVLNGNAEVDPGVVCNVETSNPGCTTISSIEQYRRTLVFQQMGLTPQQVRALGGGASQFTINAGIPQVYPGGWDIGIYAGDDWKAKPNLTISYGFRYETQANIRDRSDIAPRLAFAWAPHGSAKNASPPWVIRGGYGFFYDRFSEQNVLIAQRFNGVTQQQYVLTNPDTFSAADPSAIPTLAQLQAPASSQIIHTISSSMRAPMLMQSIIGVERQLPGKTTLALNYTNSHGTHEFRMRNINAPLPGTYTGVAGSGKFPFPNQGPIYEMESGGLYNQNQLTLNVNAHPSQKVSLFASYSLSYARSNTDGINSFPANQYDLTGEYGPASNDVRHRASLGGSIATKGGLLWSPFIILQTGAPFNIITSQDIYGDTVLTARPGFATTATQPGVIATSYGLLDPNPSAGEAIVPRNYGRGPGFYNVNLRLAKTFRFGAIREGAKDGHYGLTFSIAARNLLNHVNPGMIIGNINSPLFGQSNQIAGGSGAYSEGASNRRMEFQMRFAF